MSYDLVDELTLQEYRMNHGKDCELRETYEQPEKLKWRNGDCTKCNTAFSVITAKKYGYCICCGYPKFINTKLKG